MGLLLAQAHTGRYWLIALYIEREGEPLSH